MQGGSWMTLCVALATAACGTLTDRTMPPKYHGEFPPT